jgi:hypothetical protein
VRSIQVTIAIHCSRVVQERRFRMFFCRSEEKDVDKLLRRCGIDITAGTVPELVAALEEKIPTRRAGLAIAHEPLRCFGWMVRTSLDAGALPCAMFASGRFNAELRSVPNSPGNARRLDADWPQTTPRKQPESSRSSTPTRKPHVLPRCAPEAGGSSGAASGRPNTKGSPLSVAIPS